MVGMARTGGGVLAGMSKPLDTSFLRFVHHYGLEEISKMFSTSVDLDETRKDFEKMVRDFNSKPLKVDEEHQDQDLEDGDEDSDSDMDESESEEDEDEADGKTCKLFGDTKRASLEKTAHAPIEDEHEPKKPRKVEGSCVQGD